jgi:[histone H3]-trimethyl-L-lysine4 demethylase
MGGAELGQSRKVLVADAPVFRPTLNEFRDPIAYISSIRADAERFGICKIVVPNELVGNCSISPSDFIFQTRRQKVCNLQQRSNNTFNESYFHTAFNRYLRKEGKAPPKQTSYTVSGVEVPLWRLFKLVTSRGGYSCVTGDKRWREVARVLKVSVRLPATHRSGQPSCHTERL